MNSMYAASDYINAIIETLKSLNIPTVTYNPEFQDEQQITEIKTPAVFVLCPSLGVTTDAGNGAIEEVFNIELVCLVSAGEDSALRGLNFASWLKRKIYRQRWGLKGLSLPDRVTAIDSTGNQSGFEEWRISFSQACEMEEKHIEPTFEINEVLLGINPQSDNDYKSIGVLDE